MLAAVLVVVAIALTAALWQLDNSAAPNRPPVSSAIGAAAQVLAAIGTFAVAALTLSYVVATSQMVKEMRVARVGASVVAFADTRGAYIGLRIENFGAAPAHDVGVTFLDRLGRAGPGRSLKTYEPGEVVMIAVLAPGQVVWELIDVMTIGMKPEDLPAARVSCEWKDETGLRSAGSVVDAGPLFGAPFDATLHEVADAIRSLKH